MAALTDTERAALTALLRRSPDALLEPLLHMARTLPGAKAVELETLLDNERRDRVRREIVLGPLAPMFRPRADGVDGLSFPASVYPRLWRAVADRRPELMEMLDAIEDEDRAAAADALCDEAVEVIRRTPQVLLFDAAGRDAILSELSACLELTPVARDRLGQLEVWLKRPDGEQIAEMRLLLRDCADVREDGAHRVLEMLFARMHDAALILRVVTRSSWAADKDLFLSGSEMAGFVDRLIDGLKVRTERIVAFRPGLDDDKVDAVIADLAWCAMVLGELDATLEINPRSDWGRAVREQRVRLARQIAGFMRAASKAMLKAFPTERVRIVGSMKRWIPRLNAPTEGEAVHAAQNLLRLVGAARGAASIVGAEADRRALVHAQIERLTDYVDEGLRLIGDDDVEDVEHAFALLDLAGDGLAAIGAEDGAAAVRRRVTVARGRLDVAEASSDAA